MVDLLSRLKIRRDTSTNWVANNPVLAPGEPGVETDTFLVKFGDGATAWNALRALIGVPANAVAAARTFLNAVDAAAQRAVLGLTGNATYDAVGNIVLHAGSTAPPLTLKANGAAISRTTYAALFAKIGTTYGAGDGVTTFNLPDFRGVFGRGLDDGRGIDPGRALGVLQAAQVASHTHPFSGFTDTRGAHQHAGGLSAWSGWGNLFGTTGGATSNRGDGSSPGNVNLLTSTEGDHFHAFSGTTGATGGSETRPVNLAWLICIRYQ